MALLATGRRLPVLKELVSTLATTQSGSRPLALTRAALFSSATDKPVNKPAEEGAQQQAAAPSAGPSVPASLSSVQQGGATAAAPATQDEDEWTEVVHSSGQIYYWNERTGETTQLGQPKPQSKRGKGGAGGGSDGAGGGGGGAGGAGTSEGRAYDPRAEAPLEDRTGTYAAVGLIVGAFLGWVSQFV